ncbi:UDP-N-acetylglucosamine transferase subunit ALG13-like [Artemia franciscana]|uniref:UDP-N-acetylglucosamine transferase subunit ALG13-like n=1 Tax=Artemia franciscana TaxID=6661 RepID=UPI0032DB881D
MAMKQVVFVTVGTTKFDKLIQVVESEEFKKVLKEEKISKIIIQYGRGKKPNLANSSELEVETYSLKEDITDDFRCSDLVISHAGAGSCLEALEWKKRLIIVVNNQLMGNHQMELAKKLQANHNALCCTPNTLTEALKSASSFKFRVLDSPQTSNFVKFLDSVV